jgi:hypothetical protein
MGTIDRQSFALSCPEVSMTRRIALLSAVMMIACSAKQIGTHATANLVNVTPDIAVVVNGEGVDPQVLDQLRRHLKAKLIVAGFNIEGIAEDALKLDVDVQRFEAGSAGLRVTIGFGAGRGSLLYTARYLDHKGQVVAEMDGQERFTGGEPHFNMEYGNFATLGDAEKAREVLVRLSTSSSLGQRRPSQSRKGENEAVRDVDFLGQLKFGILVPERTRQPPGSRTELVPVALLPWRVSDERASVELRGACGGTDPSGCHRLRV